MQRRLAQLRMTSSDLKWSFHASRAISALAALLVHASVSRIKGHFDVYLWSESQNCWPCAVLDQLLLKCVSITKYKLFSRKLFQILFSITLSTNAETQNTKYFLETNFKNYFNCHETTCQISMLRWVNYFIIKRLYRPHLTTKINFKQAAN